MEFQNNRKEISSYIAKDVSLRIAILMREVSWRKSMA